MNCKKCQKEIEHRYNNQIICSECYGKRNQMTRIRKKKYIYDYLSSHPCEQCWESRPVVLEFHHIDATQKEYDLSDMYRYSIKRIQHEIDKCQVLCSNCHKIVTAKERWRYSFLNLPEFNNG